MANEDLEGLFQQLRASHGAEADQVRDILDKIQRQFEAKSASRKMRLWQALAGAALPKMMQSKNVTDETLHHGDANLRMAALLLLCQYWPRTADLLEKCEQLALSDPDIQARAMALSQIGSLYKGTNDARVGAMLARIVRDDRASANVRRSAYLSLHELRGLHLFPLHQSGMLKQGTNFSEQCDWSFVDSFIPSG